MPRLSDITIGRQRVRALVAGFIFQAAYVYGQGALFNYDLNGNLVFQSNEVQSLPVILSQPQMQTVVLGHSASFSVVAADPNTVSYQWFFNSTNVPGATNDSLLLTGVNVANQGPYSVVLTNSFGAVTSRVAQLYIDSRGVGMPDSWQLAYFGNLTNNPSGDFDGDGISNLREFLDGTNPTNSSSTLYRLTILNNGGQVDVSPNQPAYTNGQVVTLTATALSPYSFRGWGGDLLSTNNPAKVTMTTNKTVFAVLGPLNLTWTNASAGVWDVPANWSPNFVPSPIDNVFINSSVTVSISNSAECAGLTLGPGSAPTLAITGGLTLDGPSYWFAGTFSGSGRTIIGPASTLTVDNPSSVYVTSGTLENRGTIVCLGANDLTLNSAIFTNAPDALFNIQNAVSLSGSGSRFDNSGTFRKSNNAGVSTVSVVFNNSGTVDIQTGTLTCNGNLNNDGVINLSPGTTNILAHGGTSTGSWNTPATAQVTFTGNAFTPSFALNPGVQLNGPGVYRLEAQTVNLNTDVSVQNMDLISTLAGSGNLTISNVLNWLAGTMNGNGANQTLIAPGATLNLPNPYTVFFNSRTLENAGTVTWSGSSTLQTSSAVLTNCLGALFDIQKAITLTGSGSRFDNAGTFRDSNNTGTSILVGLSLDNYGTVDLQGGILEARNGYLSLPGSVLNCGLGGTVPGTNYGQLQVSGALNLNGGLSVNLLPGYSPATNDSFTIVSAGTINNAFATFSFPTNRVSMQLTNTPTLVILTVSSVLQWAAPALFSPPSLVGSNLFLSWSATPNFTYRLEYSPSLSETDWVAVPGDVTATSGTVTKTDSLTTTNRFYRVRILP